MAACVTHWINHVLEGKPGSCEKLGLLITGLINGKLLTRQQVVNGIIEIVEIADVLVCDIPRFWELIGELTGKIYSTYFNSHSLLSVPQCYSLHPFPMDK